MGQTDRRTDRAIPKCPLGRGHNDVVLVINWQCPDAASARFGPSVRRQVTDVITSALF